MSFRSRFWSIVLLFLATGPLLAQGTQPPPLSPLDLVRGLREAGMGDLAIEYLREIEKQPLSDSDKKALALERARCLLDAADQEPDEGTRLSMLGEAKEAFNEFLIQNPNHPRVAEASLAVARLISVEAKAQLNRARRMDVPLKDGPGDAAAAAKQRDEAKKAQELFKVAAKRFAEGAKLITAKLNDRNLDPLTRQSLAREKFEAELAAAVNQFHMADTVLATGVEATRQRVGFLEQAQKQFEALARGSRNNRTVWLARAWRGETLMEQSKPNDAEAEFKAILDSSFPEADEGKRLVQFFQNRRAYLDAIGERSPAKLNAVAEKLREWLDHYGKTRKPTPEVLASRYYRAFTLQVQAELAIGAPPKDGKPAPPVTGRTRTQLTEAEKIYRALSQTDNDYTARANRNRMYVVRKLLGEVDRPAHEYTVFETAQMAALIQIAKLQDAEKARTIAELKRNAVLQRGGRILSLIGLELQRLKAEAETPEQKNRILALLERARELATPRDNPADVADNLLRLVYFYQTSDQPLQAAVLGEHIARTIKSTGGKASIAGLMGVNGYVTAASQVKVDTSDPMRIAEAQEVAATYRKVDRDRAMELARFLDRTFPHDTATDSVRHRMALLLVDDKQFDRAFDVVTQIRAGYAQLTNARLLEGYIASQLITSRAKDMPMPPGGKLAVYRHATSDLARVVKPIPNAPEDDVRGYITTRARLGQLYLAQSWADDEAEKKSAGYDKALNVADEIIAMVSTFDCLTQGAVADKLNLDGMEMRLLGVDLRTRSLFLRGRALVDGGPDKFPAAIAAIQPVLDEVKKTGALMNEKMKQWAGGRGDLRDPKLPDAEDNRDPPDVAAQKARIAGLSSGIDKFRRDIIMLGFKLQVRQGKPGEAAAVLDLLKKAGGSVADNQPTFELMARELAAPIAGLKRQGKNDEAKALGDGVALLLKELVSVPNLSASSTLFIGQTLYAVDRFEDALKEFAKFPAPTVPKDPKIPPGTPWWQVDSKSIADAQARTKFQNEVRNFRYAQLYTAKALRGAKKIDEAEKLLTEIIGGAEGADAVGAMRATTSAANSHWCTKARAPASPTCGPQAPSGARRTASGRHYSSSPTLV